MPFISRACNFLTNPGALKTHKYYPIMRDTVDYLLKRVRAIGIKNAVSTAKIIAYLNNRGHTINREGWQINVLGPLRDNDVFIASKQAVGMFIIETIDDTRRVIHSMEHRIDVESERLQILKRIARQGGWKV